MGAGYFFTFFVVLKVQLTNGSDVVFLCHCHIVAEYCLLTHQTTPIHSTHASVCVKREQFKITVRWSSLKQVCNNTYDTANNSTGIALYSTIVSRRSTYFVCIRSLSSELLPRPLFLH